jgi:hypothetical protein
LFGGFAALGMGSGMGMGVYKPAAVNMDELYVQWREQLSEAFNWVTKSMPLPLPAILNPPDKVRALPLPPLLTPFVLLHRTSHPPSPPLPAHDGMAGRRGGVAVPGQVRLVARRRPRRGVRRRRQRRAQLRGQPEHRGHGGGRGAHDQPCGVHALAHGRQATGPDPRRREQGAPPNYTYTSSPYLVPA